MNDDMRLQNIEKKLDDHGDILKSIQGTLQAIAVQDEKIRAMQVSIETLYHRMDGITDPGVGIISKIQAWQASCPRSQIKSMWYVVLPMGLTQIGILVAIIATLMGGRVP